MKVQRLTGELEESTASLLVARSDAERWKIEAFQSIRQTHDGRSPDITGSEDFKKMENRVRSLEEEMAALVKQHELDLQHQRTSLMAQHLGEIAELHANLSTKEASPVPPSSMEPLPEPLPVIQQEVTLPPEKQEEEAAPRPPISKEAEEMIAMVETQLRQAEEHVLDQAELMQRTTMRLQLEIDRRNKCRKCRKQAEKDEG